MKDWKGNTIEQGHTILIVDVKTPFSDCDLVLLSPIDGSVIARSKGKRDFKWIVSQKIKVTKPSNEISMNFNKTTTSEMPINHLDFWCSTQGWQIICIEGLSDNQEEYYLEHFKNG